jgi:hypothetical protein
MPVMARSQEAAARRKFRQKTKNTRIAGAKYTSMGKLKIVENEL